MNVKKNEIEPPFILKKMKKVSVTKKRVQIITNEKIRIFSHCYKNMSTF